MSMLRMFPVTATLTLLMTCSQSLLAAKAPCEIPPLQSELRFGYDRGAGEAFRKGSGTAAVRRTHIAVPVVPVGAHIPLRFSHDYSAFDIALNSAQQPAANGHLHRLALDADLSAYLKEAWQLRLQPALAVSSNQLKEPDAIEKRAWQLNGALLREFVAGEESSWNIGICADHRFGRYRFYPAVAWQRDTPRGFVQVGWPDSRWVKQLNPVLHSSLQISPAGSRWHAWGQDEHHWFSQRAWQARIALEWRPLPALGLELSTSRLFAHRLSFELNDGSGFRQRTDALQQWGLALIWYPE